MSATATATPGTGTLYAAAWIHHSLPEAYDTAAISLFVLCFGATNIVVWHFTILVACQGKQDPHLAV